MSETNRSRPLLFALLLASASGMVLASYGLQGRTRFANLRRLPKRIVFARVDQQFPEDRKIYSMNGDGKDVQEMLTRSDAAVHIDDHPSLSVDGKWLAFDSDRQPPTTGQPLKRQIFIMAVDSHPASLIAPTFLDGNNHRVSEPDKYNVNPAWSPDGKEIAFTHEVNSGSQICVMNRKGEVIMQVGQPNGALTLDREAAWSQDGTKLAFVRDAGGSTKPQIFVVARGANPFPHSLLTVPINGVCSHPSWSWDGKSLVFAVGPEDSSRIYSARIGSNGRWLAGPLPNPGSNDWAPSWSSSWGGGVAYESHENKSAISTMNPDGSGRRPLTSPPIADHAPGW